MAAASTASPMSCGNLTHIIVFSAPIPSTTTVAAAAATPATKKHSHLSSTREKRSVLFFLAANADTSSASTRSAVAGASSARSPTSFSKAPTAAPSAGFPEVEAAAANTAAGANAALATDSVAAVVIKRDAAVAAADVVGAAGDAGAAYLATATDETAAPPSGAAAADATPADAAAVARRLHRVGGASGQMAKGGVPHGALISSMEAAAVKAAVGRSHRTDKVEVADELIEVAQGHVGGNIAAAGGEEKKGGGAAAREEEERDAAGLRKVEGIDTAAARGGPTRQSGEKASLENAGTNQLTVTGVVDKGPKYSLTHFVHERVPCAAELEAREGETAAASAAEAAPQITSTFSPHARRVQKSPFATPVAALRVKCIDLSRLKAASSIPCSAAPTSFSEKHNSLLSSATPLLLLPASALSSCLLGSGRSASSKDTLSVSEAAVSTLRGSSTSDTWAATAGAPAVVPAGAVSVATCAVINSATVRAAAQCPATCVGGTEPVTSAAAASPATPKGTLGVAGPAATPVAAAEPFLASAATEPPAASFGAASPAALDGAPATFAAAVTFGAAAAPVVAVETSAPSTAGASRAAATLADVAAATYAAASADTPSTSAAAAAPAAAAALGAVTPAAVSSPDTATPAGDLLVSEQNPPPNEGGVTAAEDVGRLRRRRSLCKFFYWAGQVLPVLLSLFSFLLTLWYYTSMVRLTQHLQQANTTSAIYADYSSAKTLAALELLEDFIERHGLEHYPFCYLNLRQQKTAEGRELDRARRHLTQWFSRIQYFYEFGYLHAAHMQRFPGPQRTRYFLDLVEPLEYVSRKTTGRKHAAVFDFLRKVYNLHEHRLDPVFVQRVKRLIKQSKKRRERGGGGADVTHCIDISSSCCRNSSAGGCTGRIRKESTSTGDDINSSSSSSNVAGCRAGSASDFQKHGLVEIAQRGENYCLEEPYPDVTCGNSLLTKSSHDSVAEPVVSPQGEDCFSSSKIATVENVNKTAKEVTEEVSGSDCGRTSVDATVGGAARASREVERQIAADGHRDTGALGGDGKEEGSGRQVLKDVNGGTRQEGGLNYTEYVAEADLFSNSEGGGSPSGSGRRSIGNRRKGMPEGVGMFAGTGHNSGDSIAGRIFHVRKAGVPSWPPRGMRKIKLFEGSLLESAEGEEEVEEDEEDEEEELEEDNDEFRGGEARRRASQEKDNETIVESADKKHNLCKRNTTTAPSTILESKSEIGSAEKFGKQKTLAPLLDVASPDENGAAAAAKDTDAAVTEKFALAAASGTHGAADHAEKETAGSKPAHRDHAKKRVLNHSDEL